MSEKGKTKHETWSHEGEIRMQLVIITYSQINEMKLSHPDVLFAIFSHISILNRNGEDSMRTGTVGIHCSCPHHPWHIKQKQQAEIALRTVTVKWL